MITKKILIFGASGQVGRYCIRRLVKNDYKITAVTRNLHQKGYILKTQAPIGYLDIVQANIFDQKKLEQLLINFFCNLYFYCRKFFLVHHFHTFL